MREIWTAFSKTEEAEKTEVTEEDFWNSFQAKQSPFPPFKTMSE